MIIVAIHTPHPISRIKIAAEQLIYSDNTCNNFT